MESTRLRELTQFCQTVSAPSLSRRNGEYPIKGIDTFSVTDNLPYYVERRNGEYPIKGIDTSTYAQL